MKKKVENKNKIHTNAYEETLAKRLEKTFLKKLAKKNSILRTCNIDIDEPILQRIRILCFLNFIARRELLATLIRDMIRLSLIDNNALKDYPKKDIERIVESIIVKINEFSHEFYSEDLTTFVNAFYKIAFVPHKKA